MKKFSLILLIIFIANLGCKKIGGGGLCACSPVEPLPSSIILKGNSGIDLLNPTTTGFYDKNQIQIYSKDVNNNIKNINVNINTPFNFVNDKITYYQLVSYELIALAKSIDNTFYLKLGSDKIYQLNLQVKNGVIIKLLVDNVAALQEYASLKSIYTLQVR